MVWSSLVIRIIFMAREPEIQSPHLRENLTAVYKLCSTSKDPPPPCVCVGVCARAHACVYMRTILYVGVAFSKCQLDTLW